MQPFPATTNDVSSDACAVTILDGAPNLVWYVRRHMRRYRKGLSVPQFRALFKIQQQPDASLSCVAEHLGASLPTASRIIANLVGKGFIARAYSERDRREMTLKLTPAGRAIIAAARKASLARIGAECSALSPADRAAIVAAFKILIPFIAGVQQSASAPAADAPAALRPRKAAPVAELT